jgi:hypothetical protein
MTTTLANIYQNCVRTYEAAKRYGRFDIANIAAEDARSIGDELLTLGYDEDIISGLRQQAIDTVDPNWQPSI